MHPSYSPLFTLGLLAERRPGSCSPHSTLQPSASLSRASTKAHSFASADDDHASAFLTLPAAPTDAAEFRSFLSLDLADSNSIRRKPSDTSKSTSWTCASHLTTPHPLSRIQTRTLSLLPPSTSPGALRRSSRESLRHIPSAKPAPRSVVLPEPPRSLDHPSDLSPPSKFIPSQTDTSFSAPLLPPTVSTKPSSFCSLSINSHQRRKSRMYTLACLEGRSCVATHIPRSNLRKNFMSMTDDDDESKSPSPSPNTPSIQVDDFGSFADTEDEADTIISPKRLSTFPRSISHPTKRKRRSTIDSWFPLKSFIDLKDDDLTWNWRSFVEIGGVL